MRTGRRLGVASVAGFLVGIGLAPPLPGWRWKLPEAKPLHNFTTTDALVDLDRSLGISRS